MRFFSVCFMRYPLLLSYTLAFLSFAPLSLLTITPYERAMSLAIWGQTSKQSKFTVGGRATFLRSFMLLDRILKGFLSALLLSPSLLLSALNVFSLVTLYTFFLAPSCSSGDTLSFPCTVIVQIFMISFFSGSWMILKESAAPRTRSSLIWVFLMKFWRKVSACVARMEGGFSTSSMGYCTLVTVGNLMYMVLYSFDFYYIIIMRAEEQPQPEQEEGQGEGEGEMELREYYRSVQQQIQEKFRTLTTDTLEEIKNKMKRQQDRVDQEENITLIEKERGRIVQEMREHVEKCFHPSCELVDEIILLYDLFRHAQKQDPVTLIVRRNVKGLPKLQTDCYLGARINAKMKETHRLISGLRP